MFTPKSKIFKNIKLIKILFKQDVSIILLVACFLPLENSFLLLISDLLPESEMNALICFYNATKGLNWNISSDEGCTFEGVSCQSQLTQSTVVGLNVANKGLNGTIPACLSNLTNLEILSLVNNHFNGSIPPEIGKSVNVILQKKNFTFCLVLILILSLE
ncbi:hypothetical protein RFI_22573 [Reticulomyxa filosa]|uniref:Leucine-rich repeat-containing N-terminal plant-type domain-containing protein n=1 Tax=Reticulomyxa filosa TaxID=46433 RepID=X6MNZ1_RETFI|nr:hypothetical protein RFI_22573 [Reticulomyxa filosa]|eukprot:ETO14795.1 hypothetical protein RFI_22573 [Reticulomyxa filosa]